MFFFFRLSIVYICFEVDIKLASLCHIEPDPSSSSTNNLSVSIPFSPLDPGWEATLPMRTKGSLRSKMNPH